jgi:hypothetical protein
MPSWLAWFILVAAFIALVGFATLAWSVAPDVHSAR